MKTVRRWHVLVLLGLVVDLVNPTMPGIFSLVHGGLFMDGVTRAHGSLASAACVRDCPRARTSAEAPRAEVAGGTHVIVRDARRTYEHPDPWRTLHVTAAPGSADADDH